MYQRIIALVAGSLFALLAIVSGVLTDLHDRSYPQALSASSSLYLDFSRAGRTDDQALTELASMSDDLDLGLVRVLPDLAGDADGQVFAVLGRRQPGLPERFDWYGDQPTGVVRSERALEHSFATGTYLVTGSRARLGDAMEQLTREGVTVRRVDDTPAQSASFLVRQESFRTTLVASLALMVAMALFWLSVRARGRALRVLGGVPGGRIQAEDLVRLAVPVALPAIPVTVAAAVVVAWRHGTAWLGYFTTALVGLELVVVAVTLAGAAIMSVVSWPSTRMLAARQPALPSLRRAANLLKLASFVLVLLTAGPAWWAYGDAQDAAAQEARWRSLSDQVALRFPAGLGEDGFVDISKQVGGVVADAQASGDAALSYALPPDNLGVEDAPYDYVVLVDRGWLDLMGIDSDLRSGRTLRAVEPDSIPGSVSAGLRANLDLWVRPPETGQELWDSLRVATTRSDQDLPMASAGNGDLVFPRHPLVLVVPSVASFNDDFLASLTSTNNLVLAGLDPTLALLAKHGLAQTIQVKYAAEDGVLRAQFAAYEAWLRGFALAALAGSFVLALAISAVISALLSARRDFPLRLDGRSWASVLRPRVGQEWVIGLALAAVVLLVQPFGAWPPTLVALAVGLAGTAAAHLFAASWTFRRVASRSI